MSEQQEFPQGMRVTMTAKAKIQFRDLSSKSGIVKGRPYHPGLIRILRDGKKVADTWSPSFWEKESVTGIPATGQKDTRP